MERRLAAILAADVAGYSHLTELNDEVSTETLRSYCSVLESAIAAHRGRVFSKAGDSVVAEFPSIVEAIRCAVEIQHEIADRNTSVSKERRMQFRIGVNLGDVIAEDSDVYGTGVNVAARLEQLAEPGGVCISQTVYEQVRKIVEMSFQDIGDIHLKNIEEPVRVYRILEGPLPWFRKLFSRTRGRRRLAFHAGLAVLVLSLIAAASYVAAPPAMRTAFFSHFGRLSMPERPAIAILPFSDLSATGDQQYLADGITEELTTALAKFPDLLVMARNSTLGYKDKPVDIRQVGRELHVHYVVEGTIQHADQNVRVTAQLVDAGTGSQIWADRYDRHVSNIFDIRDEITRNIAGTLMGTNGKLADAELARLSTKDPNSFTAYDYLMRGWQEWYKFTREDNLAARDFFEKARTVDPNYARAYAGLAWSYSSDYDFEWTDDSDKTLKLALDMAETAVRLDGNDYHNQWALGWACLFSRQHDKALASYQRARDLNPNDAELLAEMANLLIYTGQAGQAVNQIQEAIRLNPFHAPWYLEFLGWAYAEADMPEKAIETLEKTIGPDPNEDELWVLPSLAASYADPKIGRPDDAQKVVQQMLVLNPSVSISELQARSPYKTKDLLDRWVARMRRAGIPE